MLKLMKYEFRKLRAALLAMLGALAALEIGFVAGGKLDKPALSAVCIGLITVLVFIVYAYILLAGMASYSRELKEKSGYLIFMAPVRPIGVVLSKLVFTALAAIVATAVFGLAAWLDYRWLFSRMNIDPQILDQINLVLRFGLNANADILQILRLAGYTLATVLIQIMLTMCIAYLAITLAATLLQNRKGFFRGLISLVLFGALTWSAGWLDQRLLYDHIDTGATLRQLTGALGWSLLLNLALSAVFAWLSAFLLDRKVNL